MYVHVKIVHRPSCDKILGHCVALLISLYQLSHVLLPSKFELFDSIPTDVSWLL